MTAAVESFFGTFNKIVICLDEFTLDLCGPDRLQSDKMVSDQLLTQVCLCVCVRRL